MATIRMLSAALLLLLPLVMGVSLGPLDTDTASAAQLTGGGDHLPQRRSAREELDELRQCKVEQCSKAPCEGCGPDDEDCADMCRINCECGCGGHPRGGVDHDAWQMCHSLQACWTNFEACMDSCAGEQECVAKCELVYNKCYCECLHDQSLVQAIEQVRQQAMEQAMEQVRQQAICVAQCPKKICSECTEADELCPKRCARRCKCECVGHPWSDLSGEWEECFIGTQSCEAAHSGCVKECSAQEMCKVACDLALILCRCNCRSVAEAWTKCNDEECRDRTCSKCDEGDTDCAQRCRHNCKCHRCLGIAADNLDDYSFQECKKKSGCRSEHEKCREKCKAAQNEKQCRLSCQMAKERCHCKCAQTNRETERRESERGEIIQHCNYIN